MSTLQPQEQPQEQPQTLPDLPDLLDAVKVSQEGDTMVVVVSVQTEVRIPRALIKETPGGITPTFGEMVCERMRCDCDPKTDSALCDSINYKVDAYLKESPL